MTTQIRVEKRQDGALCTITVEKDTHQREYFYQKSNCHGFSVILLMFGERLSSLTLLQALIMKIKNPICAVILTLVSAASFATIHQEQSFNETANPPKKQMVLDDMENSGSSGEKFTKLDMSDDTKKSYDKEKHTHVSPIPEPETYAMLLAGLAAIAFMSRRKSFPKK